MDDPEQITREILWNVGRPTRAAMYTLFIVSMIAFGYGIWRRLRVWRRGAGTGATWGGGFLAPGDTVGTALVRVVRHVLLQLRIARIPLAYVSHIAIFYGVIVLFIGTVLVAIEHYGVAHFFYGRFYLVASFMLDLFGLGFVVALAIAMLRRVGLTRVLPSSKSIDAAILWMMLAIGLTGFFVEALRIAAQRPDFETVSFVGWWTARAMWAGGISTAGAEMGHFVLWWLHMVLVFAWIAMIPYTKLLHLLVAPANIAITPEHRSGRFEPVSIEQVEETGTFGVGTIAEFHRGQLLSFDACTHCRRCETACPAYATNKPLSPMRVVLDVAAAGEHQGSLHGEVISAETLWSCTTCGACVHQCPVLINQLGAIVDMRRHLVGEGRVVGSSQAALRSIGATGNPWGQPLEERDAWAEGLDVPTVETKPEVDVLLWVGCAGSYDRRNQGVTRAMVRILKAAGIDFAILGKRERCTGDPARRIGDEFTFIEQATANVETLSSVKFNRVVTACAHCFNTLVNEYPDFGGEYRVMHHTEFIAELLESGRLHVEARAAAERITLHDPCYLSRHNGKGAAPRRVLGQLTDDGLPIVEPEQSGERTFCCGGGGGRMWMEEDVDKRVNFARFAQLRSTGAKTVATACPYCTIMLDDAAKDDEHAGIEVKDVAELVAEQLSDGRGAGGAR